MNSESKDNSIKSVERIEQVLSLWDVSNCIKVLFKKLDMALFNNKKRLVNESLAASICFEVKAEENKDVLAIS